MTSSSDVSVPAPLDAALANAVPADARRILDAACGDGRLGAALRAVRPGCRITGIDGSAAAVAAAAGRLDEVRLLDAARSVPPFGHGSFDTVLCNRLLERADDPLAALRRLAATLTPDGVLLAVVHNAQHHSVLSALLRGDLQYGDGGILDRRHRHFFTYATVIKLMMDAGLIPRLLTAYLQRHPPALGTVLEPMLRHTGVAPVRAALHLNAQQYLFEARPLNWPVAPEEPLTFVVCANSDEVLRDNLLSSPCLGPGTPHQVVVVRDATSAADGLNRGIDQARHPLVVGVHQDVYLPDGWPARFLAQYRLAEERFGRLGVAGVYGTRTVNGQALRFGRVMDRHSLLWEPQPLPAAVETLDELLLAVPRDVPVRFDPAMGFHFYGVDMACAVRERGLAAAVLDAPCFHNSQFGDVLPAVFYESADVFRRKWPHLLPVATPSDVVR